MKMQLKLKECIDFVCQCLKILFAILSMHNTIWM